jgi:peptidoglycan/xylan/chitin deacetylase (PgdA/CDA1 family)
VATFFIVPKYIGNKNHITREQILEMTRQGMRFESHSLTHPYLLSLSTKEIDEEVYKSKNEIQSLLNCEVNHFSVPYGFYNRYLVRCVEKAGYKSMVTENFGYYIANKNPFPILPRFIVKSRMETGKFKQIVEKRKGQLITDYSKALCIQNLKKILGYRTYIRLKSLILNLLPSDIYK